MFSEITVKDVVKALGVKQRNSLVEFRPKKQRLYMKAPEFVFGNGDGGEGGEGAEGREGEGLFIDTEIGEGDMMTQLLRMINPKFQIVGNGADIVKEFRNRMAFDLDKLKLYTKFGYSKMGAEFNRKKVYDILVRKDLACQPNFFGSVFTMVMRYLVDYFDINIVVYRSDYKFEKLLGRDIYFSRREGRKFCKEKPVIEFVYTTRFCPVVDEGGCGVRKWCDRLEAVFEEEKMDLIDYKAMTGYKVSELTAMAEGAGVSLKKKSEKTGKLIKKSKKELYEDLFYLVNL